MSRYWPYNTHPREAARKILVLIAGLAVGAKATTLYYDPLKVQHFRKGPNFRCRTFTKNWMRGNENSYYNIDNGSTKLASTKSTSPPSPQMQTGYQSPSEEHDNQSQFRTLFKKYKSRVGELDLDAVIDLRVSIPSLGLEVRPVQSDVQVERSQLDIRPVSEWNLATFKHRPGLYILTQVLSPTTQLGLMQKSLLSYPEPPNITNLTVDGSYNKSDVFANMSNKLRWATLGNDYDWTSKTYASTPRSDVPKELSDLAGLVSGVLGLGQMRADAVILNYYPPKATLSAHVDRSERDISKPLVSVSLGQSAIYLCGGTSLDDPVDALLLHSGDVLVMHGSQRLVYHAVPRILKTRSFETTQGIESQVVDYANKCRVNITIRQVD